MNSVVIRKYVILLSTIILLWMLSACASPNGSSPAPIVVTSAVTGTALRATPVLTSGAYFTSTFFSPDNKWRYEFIGVVPTETPDSQYVQLKLIKTDGTVAWTVLDTWSLRIDDFLPQFFQWSKDDRYFFFVRGPAARKDWCSTFTEQTELYRADLLDGSLSLVADSLEPRLWLSPDGRLVAHEGQDGILRLKNLMTGQESQFNVGAEYRTREIAWSPNDSAFMLTLGVRPCETRFANPSEATAHWTLVVHQGALSYSIVRADILTSILTTLISEDPRYFVAIDWPTSDTVVLKDMNYEQWNMNAITGQITKQ